MSSITIGPVHLYPNRIVITIGLIRTFIRGEFRHNSVFNKTDKMILLWSSIMLLTRFIKPRQDVSIILRFGEVYNALGIYLLFRFLIKDMEDIKIVLKTLAGIFLILASCMIHERLTDHNLFSILGGVDLLSNIRNGEIRCQGPFAHSILAGTVAATSAPWFYALIAQRNRLRKYGFIGLLACMLIVFFTASSGPIMSLLSVFFGLGAWVFRNNMKTVRTGVFVSLVCLHLIMKAPVWYLISRFDFTGSSTGWHRSELIDTSIRHFDEWWFAGTDYTAHWMPTGVNWSGRHTDITNYYIRNGVNGGLITLVLFVMVLVSGFSLIGRAIKNINANNKHYRFIAWAIGCTLFSHTITFFSVSYFDQSQMFFFLDLAMIGCMYNFSLMTRQKRTNLREDVFD